MRVLVACEFSGTVRRAFAALGHDAWSVDFLPAEDRSNQHIVGDARDYLADGWDLLAVFHPPCTRLCNSGVRWLTNPPPGRTSADMWAELDAAADLFSTFWETPHIERVCIENPIMHGHAKRRIRGYRAPAQFVQPWQHGHPETKATGLWLRNLPELAPTRVVPGRLARVHRMPGGKNQWRERSRTYAGIASAMAAQWGDLDGMTPTVRERLPPWEPPTMLRGAYL
jgi:hypothetical protein